MNQQEQRPTAAFIGGGLIGAGLAANAALSGFQVCIYDILFDQESERENCQNRVRSCLQSLVDKSVVDQCVMETSLSHIVFTPSVQEAVENACFIQEAGPERYEVKWSILEQVEQYAGSDVPIASTTSGLLITEIQKKARHPERIIGGHPYNPAYLIPLIEVTKGEQSSDAAAQAAMEFYRGIGKEPVLLQKETIGFIANRLQMAVYREAVDLVMRGVCTVEDVDKSLVYGPGLRWGIMGQILITHLSAAPGGIITAAEKYKDSTAKRLADLADWKSMPEGWGEKGQAGIEEEIAHRPEWMGRDMDSIAAWRDDMLVALLKLHRKL